MLEYLELLPKGLKNADKVLEGYWNNIKMKHNSLSEEEQKEILRRRLICDSCPFNSVNAQTSEEYKELFGEYYKTNRKILHCSICKCPRDTKTSSLSSDCGIKDSDETKDFEYKWTAIK
jgi:hypothetical protein